MKIAIVGSAPSSAPLAPYDDPEWTIWGCSPAATRYTRRVDEWFEIHRWGQDWLDQGYRDCLANLGKPVHMIEPVPEIPTSVAYPKDEIVAEFGRDFFTSTPAWMLALAIVRITRRGPVHEDTQGLQRYDDGSLASAPTIGLWGIDMASDDEYALQKPGCLFFRYIARQRGIKVTIPPESDLHTSPPLYGFDETNPMLVKLLSRQAELRERIAKADATIEQATREKLYLGGAEENVRYVINTWVGYVAP